MDLSSLKEIGLTDGEVKVYLALLKLGATKTGPLAVSANVSSSKVYKILARLEKKGLASHGIRSGITYFSPLEPKRILDYIDEEKSRLESKRETVEKLLPSLIEQMNHAQKSQATVLYGFKAFSNYFKGMLDELKAGDTYYVIGGGYFKQTPEQYTFFNKYHQLRSQKKVKVMLLVNNNVKDLIVPNTKLFSEIKYLPDFLMTSIQITFFKNKTLMTITAGEPIAFLIESEEVVKSFKKYFDAFWKIAEK